MTKLMDGKVRRVTIEDMFNVNMLLSRACNDENILLAICIACLFNVTTTMTLRGVVTSRKIRLPRVTNYIHSSSNVDLLLGSEVAPTLTI